MTVHSRRNKRGRTEIDIATKYFEEEKEKTKAIMKKKKRQFASVSPKKIPHITKSSINTQIEKKKKKYPKKKINRSHSSKLSTYSSKKNKFKKRKKRLKRARTQYFQRYNVQ